MKIVGRVAAGAAVIAALIALPIAVVAQVPAYNNPPPPSPAPSPASLQPSAAMAPPTLLPEGAPREAVIAWLSRNIPASRGRQVYVNGDEAFWIEHQDVEVKNPMKITATLHAENFADPDLMWRSSYQVTQFDCETQQQRHLYLTRYPGSNLSGEATREGQLIRHADFVGPTTLDFAHLRAVCLAAYDQIRKRPYTVEIPGP